MDGPSATVNIYTSHYTILQVCTFAKTLKEIYFYGSYKSKKKILHAFPDTSTVFSASAATILTIFRTKEMATLCTIRILSTTEEYPWRLNDISISN